MSESGSPVRQPWRRRPGHDPVNEVNGLFGTLTPVNPEALEDDEP